MYCKEAYLTELIQIEELERSINKADGRWCSNMMHRGGKGEVSSYCQKNFKRWDQAQDDHRLSFPLLTTSIPASLHVCMKAFDPWAVLLILLQQPASSATIIKRRLPYVALLHTAISIENWNLTQPKTKETTRSQEKTRNNDNGNKKAGSCLTVP